MRAVVVPPLASWFLIRLVADWFSAHQGAYATAPPSRDCVPTDELNRAKRKKYKNCPSGVAGEWCVEFSLRTRKNYAGETSKSLSSRINRARSAGGVSCFAHQKTTDSV